MINVNIFIRKKSSNNHYSVERFAESLKKSYFKNLKINIKTCPLTSKGLINRIYLIFWAYFNQEMLIIFGEI